MESFVFMIFGLGFFLYCIHLATCQQNADYHRRIMEAREFGFADTPEESKKRPAREPRK